MSASIMMVTYNRLNLTQKTFDTTLKNAGCKYNLIIIDNNSEDNTVKWLKENVPSLNLPYKIICLNKNMGIAYGRNMGLKIDREHYSSDYLCTLDNDVILPNNWLNKCIDVLKINKQIGACGINLEGTKYPKTKIKLNGIDEEIQIKPRGNLGTAAQVFRKEDSEKLGYFENYEAYGHEDAIWGYKLRMLGKILVYLGENGEHLGVDKEDSGEYREMKNKYWKINMVKFEKDIRDYANKKRSLYNSFTNYDVLLER